MDKEFLELLSKMADEDLSGDNIIHASQTASHLGQMISNDNIYEHTFMPAYLKEQIINRTEQPDIQAFKTNKRFSKRLELFLFGCKVTASVAASLVIMAASTTLQSRLIETNLLQASVLRQTEHQDTDISDSIMKHLNKGSSDITNWLQSVSNAIMDGKSKNK